MGERDKIRVLLLYGGRSAEHDVSRVSAVAVARALDPERYEIVPVGITREGRWLLSEDTAAAIREGPVTLPDAFEVGGDPVAAVADPARPGLVRLDGGQRGRDVIGVDVVVPMLHGPFGEDGTVQGLFELAEIPYVGSGVVGSAVGMDKVMTKRALRSEGLPVARHLDLRAWEVDAETLERVGSELGYPCFVKPANLGSSVGVSKVHDRSELEPALEQAHAYDEWAVVEEAIDGREIEVAILGDRPPEVSRPGEIVPGHEFYDYADKYEGGGAQLHVPAELPAAAEATAADLAVRAFLACRCESMARVDFLYEEGGRGFLVNEVNTIPGFTPVSMYPMLWEASGVSYPQLLDRLVELAFARHRRRAGLRGSRPGR